MIGFRTANNNRSNIMNDYIITITIRTFSYIGSLPNFVDISLRRLDRLIIFINKTTRIHS